MCRAIIGLASAMLCLPARAADLSPSPSFSLTSYLWATAIDGRSATLPPLPAADTSLSFRDVLKDLNGAVMLAGEMRVGRWGFLVDGQYSRVTSGGDPGSPLLSSVKVRSRSITVQGAALYSVYQGGGASVDAAAGLRLWNLDNKLEVVSAAGGHRLDLSQSRRWVDPTVGVRLGLDLGAPWSIAVAGDIGGFGAGSRFSWQALASVDYGLSETWTLKAGYRALYVDYRRGGFSYEATLHGPAVAATYRF